MYDRAVSEPVAARPPGPDVSGWEQAGCSKKKVPGMMSQGMVYISPRDKQPLDVKFQL